MSSSDYSHLPSLVVRTPHQPSGYSSSCGTSSIAFLIWLPVSPRLLTLCQVSISRTCFRSPFCFFCSFHFVNGCLWVVSFIPTFPCCFCLFLISLSCPIVGFHSTHCLAHLVCFLVLLSRSSDYLDCFSLGARGGVPSWYIASTSQGNGQCTQHLPTQYISSTFRIFPTNFHAIFPAQEMISTFTVSQVM